MQTTSQNENQPSNSASNTQDLQPSQISQSSSEQTAPTQGTSIQVNMHVSAPQQNFALAIGKERNWFVVLLLGFITLGIYSLIYLYSIFEEAKRFAMVKNPQINVTSGGAAIGFMFIPFFNGIWAIMLLFKHPGLLTKLNQAAGKQSPSWGYLGFVSLFLPIVGSLVVFIVTQMKLNAFWREQKMLLTRRN